MSETKSDKKVKPELWPEIRLANAMFGWTMRGLVKLAALAGTAAASDAHRRLLDRRARRIVKK